MAYLIDTHVLIWFQEDNPKLPVSVMALLQNKENHIYISQISLFEIAIKKCIGKLPLFTATVMDVFDQAIKDGFVFIPIHNKHIAAYNSVPLLPQHRDPFDRMLIATAYEENLKLITADSNFKLYPDFANTIWEED